MSGLTVLKGLVEEALIRVRRIEKNVSAAECLIHSLESLGPVLSQLGGSDQTSKIQLMIRRNLNIVNAIIDDYVLLQNKSWIVQLYSSMSISDRLLHATALLDRTVHAFTAASVAQIHAMLSTASEKSPSSIPELDHRDENFDELKHQCMLKEQEIETTFNRILQQFFSQTLSQLEFLNIGNIERRTEMGSLVICGIVLHSIKCPPECISIRYTSSELFVHYGRVESTSFDCAWQLLPEDNVMPVQPIALVPSGFVPPSIACQLNQNLSCSGSCIFRTTATMDIVFAVTIGNNKNSTSNDGDKEVNSESIPSTTLETDAVTYNSSNNKFPRDNYYYKPTYHVMSCLPSLDTLDILSLDCDRGQSFGKLIKLAIIGQKDGILQNATLGLHEQIQTIFVPRLNDVLTRGSDAVLENFIDLLNSQLKEKEDYLKREIAARNLQLDTIRAEKLRELSHKKREQRKLELQRLERGEEELWEWERWSVLTGWRFAFTSPPSYTNITRTQILTKDRVNSMCNEWTNLRALSVTPTKQQQQQQRGGEGEGGEGEGEGEEEYSQKAGGLRSRRELEWYWLHDWESGDWEYAYGFRVGNTFSADNHNALHRVRRRRWVRRRVFCDDEAMRDIMSGNFDDDK
jgi:hypothetical protein